jgi:hypothetical protein
MFNLKLPMKKRYAEAVHNIEVLRGLLPTSTAVSSFRPNSSITIAKRSRCTSYNKFWSPSCPPSPEAASGTGHENRTATSGFFVSGSSEAVVQTHHGLVVGDLQLNLQGNGLVTGVELHLDAIPAKLDRGVDATSVELDPGLLLEGEADALLCREVQFLIGVTCRLPLLSVVISTPGRAAWAV